MHSLPLFHRIAGTRVVVVGDGAIADAKRRLVERAGGVPCAETEAHHAALAFVAQEDARRAENAATRLRRLGLLVNVADRPELCDFTTPSVLEREPVLIAVSTGGASAGLAKQLRLRLERLLPATLGALASGLEDAREALRRRWPAADARRRALDAALAEGGPLDPLEPNSAGQVAGWLKGDTGPDATAVHDFTLRSTDPEELTLRQARLLGTCDTLLHDPALPPAILNRARADAVRRALPGEARAEDGVTVILRLDQTIAASTPVSAK